MNAVTPAGEFPTGNYSLATVLSTLSYKQEFEQLCFNAYYNGERPERDANGRLKKLGVVKFKFRKTNAECPGVDFKDVLDAYDGKTTPGAELDEVIDGAIESRGLDPSVKELLVLAYAECAKNALANLRDIREMPHTVPAHIVIIRDGMPMVIPENASDELKEEWGIAK